MKKNYLFLVFLLFVSTESFGQIKHIFAGRNNTYIVSSRDLELYNDCKIIISSPSIGEKELKCTDLYGWYYPEIYKCEAIQDTSEIILKYGRYKLKQGKYVSKHCDTIFSGKIKPMLSKICDNEDSLKLLIEHSDMRHKGIYECIPTYWREDSISKYGISIDSHYQLAFIKTNENYFLVNLSASHLPNSGIIGKDYSMGEIKASLQKTVKESVYIGRWFDYFGMPIPCLVNFYGGTMKVKIGDDECAYIKMDDGTGTSQSETLQSAEDSHLKSTGSGFIVSGNVVATNYHIIDDAEKIKVVLNVNNVMEEFDSKVLATDKTNDLALLTIKDPKFKPLPSAPYSIEKGTTDVGSAVFTMGYPLANVLGEEVKITDGIISSKTGFQGDIVTYQISAPIQPGNSGGALFDKKGHLVGITNAGITSDAADNVGYAIKSPYLLNLIDAAPIDIELPKGSDLSGKDLPTIIKAFKPYVAFIKIYE